MMRMVHDPKASLKATGVDRGGGGGDGDIPPNVSGGEDGLFYHPPQIFQG